MNALYNTTSLITGNLFDFSIRSCHTMFLVIWPFLYICCSSLFSTVSSLGPFKNLLPNSLCLIILPTSFSYLTTFIATLLDTVHLSFIVLTFKSWLRITILLQNKLPSLIFFSNNPVFFDARFSTYAFTRKNWSNYIMI